MLVFIGWSELLLKSSLSVDVPTQVEKEMADMVGQAEEKERKLNKSRKRLERKLVRTVDLMYSILDFRIRKQIGGSLLGSLRV